MIVLVEFISCNLDLHESSCFSIQPVLFTLATVVVNYSWVVIFWKPWHDDIKQHHWRFPVKHQTEPINVFFRASTRHDKKTRAEFFVFPICFVANAFERFFIFNFAIFLIFSPLLKQREVWENLWSDLLLFQNIVITASLCGALINIDADQIHSANTGETELMFWFPKNICNAADGAKSRQNIFNP